MFSHIFSLHGNRFVNVWRMLVWFSFRYYSHANVSTHKYINTTRSRLHIYIGKCIQSTQLCMHMHICVMYPYVTSTYYCKSDQSFFVCVCLHTKTHKKTFMSLSYIHSLKDFTLLRFSTCNIMYNLLKCVYTCMWISLYAHAHAYGYTNTNKYMPPFYTT